MDDNTGDWLTEGFPPSGPSTGEPLDSVQPAGPQTGGRSPSSRSKIAGYEFRRLITETESSYVWDAWDSGRNQRVAIKEMRLPEADPEEVQEFINRFRRSAEAARGNHPNIVGVYLYLEVDGKYFIVMEFVDGGTLKGRIDDGPPMTIADIKTIMNDLFSALIYSHAMDIVHRDVKPANLMLGAQGRWKLTDFGIARFQSSTTTQYGTYMGTPAYSSPEQVAGDPVDKRTDIYSCGVVLYELLTGKRPFLGSPETIRRKIQREEPVPPSQVGTLSSPALDEVVARAMAKNRRSRFVNIEAFQTALRMALDAAPGNNNWTRGPTDEPGKFRREDSDDGGTIWITNKNRIGSPLPPVDDTPLPPDDRGRLTRLLGLLAAFILLAGAASLAWQMFFGTTSDLNQTKNIQTVPPPASSSRAPEMTPSGSALPPPVYVPPATQPPATPEPDPIPIIRHPTYEAAPVPSEPSPGSASGPSNGSSRDEPGPGWRPSPEPPPSDNSSRAPSFQPDWPSAKPSGSGSAGNAAPRPVPLSNPPAAKPGPAGNGTAGGSANNRPIHPQPKPPEPIPPVNNKNIPPPEPVPVQPVRTLEPPATPGRAVGLLCSPPSSGINENRHIPDPGVPLIEVLGVTNSLPADRAGIRSGDILQKTGAVSFAGDFTTQCLIVPPSGSQSVTLKVWRNGDWRSINMRLN